MSDSRTVSTIMSACNPEAFVAEALDRSRARLGRTLELIVIDDGSTDGIPLILSDRAAAWHRPGRTLHLVRQAKAAMHAGRFDPALHACTDLDFWVRIAVLRPDNIGGISEVFAACRKRRGHVTGDRSRMRQNWLRVWDRLGAAGLVCSSRDFACAYGGNAFDCSRNTYQAGIFADASRLVA